MEQKILDKIGEIGASKADRRDFLKKAGKTAAAVPAVALLLSANATPAAASGRYGGSKGGKGHGHDDDHGHGHAYGHDKPHGPKFSLHRREWINDYWTHKKLKFGEDEPKPAIVMT